MDKPSVQVEETEIEMEEPEIGEKNEVVVSRFWQCISRNFGSLEGESSSWVLEIQNPKLNESNLI